MTAQSESIVAMLAIYAAHYDAFRTWCQKCWSGCAHGFDLRVATFDSAADALLHAAESSGWIRRGSFAPRPEQRVNLQIGISEGARFRRHQEQCKAVGLNGSKRPEHFHWEPDRESPSYCEFIAFIQLERCVFVPLVERWRQYAIESEKATLAKEHAQAMRRAAEKDKERATKHKEVTKQRAFLLCGGRRDMVRAAGPLLCSCLAALPHVRGRVRAQLEHAIKTADVIARMRVPSDPAWDEADARRMAEAWKEPSWAVAEETAKP